MKYAISIIILFLSVNLSAQNMPGMKMPMKKKVATQQTQKVIYTCPMHPEVKMDKPGNCPKCGMKLVKKTIKTIPPKTVSKKQADMNVQLNDTSKKMYKENMNMDDHKNMKMDSMKDMNMPKEENKDQVQPTTYTCPMHPKIHSSKSGNCPICGMKLIKEKPKANPNPATQNHDKMQMDKDKPMDKSMDMDKKMDMGNMKMDDGKSMQMDKPVDRLMGYKLVENSQPPRTVRYDLYVRDTMVTFGKKSKRAIAVNGQIPMPTLTFTEGDTAEIYVHNELNEETSLHWHGLFLPNRMDGVPFLTQMPIKPHSTYFYKFPIVQHGTHWYHSHTKLQEQIGMYGAFIMNKRKEWNIPTIPVVISEWTDMKPEEVHRSLRAATDWFAIQKGTTQSYAEAIKTGHFKTKLTNEWKRMNAMDVSDVYYDAFLINGKKEDHFNPPSGGRGAGDKVRLRIANGGASDYFWLTYSGGKITVVANDGNDVEPVEVDRLIIAVSETYDVVVTVPEDKSYEFLVTPEDRTKSASLWLGSGEKVPAAKLPKLKYFAGMKMMNDMMDMQGNMIEMEGMTMQNQEMDMNTVMYPEITGPEKPGDEMNMPARPSGGNDKKDMQMPGPPPGGDKMKKDSMHQDHDMKDMKQDTTKSMDMNNPKQKDNMHGHNMQMPNNNSMAGMNMADDNSDIVTLNYGMLRAPEKTTLPEGQWRELKFDLTGNMNRYVWSLDNKVVSEADNILIKKGENLRIIMFNNSMMRHPMHLHGHDFRVLNGQGEYAPLKNVLDIMPMERDTIEFNASEAGGDWFFHCHILYHMMSGMGRVFSYDNTLVDKTDITDAKVAKRGFNADGNQFHPMGRVGIESNGSDGVFMLEQTRWKLSTLWHLGYHDMHGYESETMVGRYLGRNQWLYPYVGFDYHYKTEGPFQKNFFDMHGSVKNIFGGEEKNWFGQKSNKNNRHTAVAGIAYTLPTLTVADFRVDGNGKFRFQLSREDLAVTPRLRFNWMINTDKEYMAGFRYITTKYISLSTHYDSDMGIGAGITLTY